MNIERLPLDLIRYVYKFVDYETRIDCYLHANPMLTDKKLLWNNFTLQQLNNLYHKGIVEKMSVKRKDSNRRVLIDDITKEFDNIPSYTYIDEHGDEFNFKIMHPVLEILQKYKLSTNISSRNKIGLITECITSLRNIDCDKKEAIYKIRRICYHFIRSILYYKRILYEREQLQRSEQERQERRKEFLSMQHIIEKKLAKRKTILKLPVTFTIRVNTRSQE